MMHKSHCNWCTSLFTMLQYAKHYISFHPQLWRQSIGGHEYDLLIWQAVACNRVSMTYGQGRKGGQVDVVDGNERGRWAEHCSVSRWRVNIKLSSYFLCQLQSWTLPRAGYRRHTKLQMLDCRCLEWVWAVDLRRMASPCKCEREQICRRGSECVNKMSRHKIGSHPGSRSVCAKYSRAWF